MPGISLRDLIRNDEISKRTKLVDIAQGDAQLKWQRAGRISRRIDGHWGHGTNLQW
jgi:hypothetical protein